jgi:hypothetical protein
MSVLRIASRTQDNAGESSQRASAGIGRSWTRITKSELMSNSFPPAKVMAYALLRVAFGVNFAGHGFVRILNGVGSFAGTTASHMAKSAIPRELVVSSAYLISFIKAVLGLALIFGVLTRVSLICGALFMMALAEFRLRKRPGTKVVNGLPTNCRSIWNRTARAAAQYAN